MQSLHPELRNDVNTLGETLGEVLQAQKGKDFFNLVETTRLIAKEARESPINDNAAIIEHIRAIPRNRLRDLARAFANFLSLANTAELYHRTRLAREINGNREPIPKHASMEGAVLHLISSGKSKSEVYKTICNLNIDLVLTAHPTELKRRTILDKMNHIAKLLGRRDQQELTGWELKEWSHNLRREVTAIWLTDEIRRRKPSPEEEARHGLQVIEKVLWRQLPQFYRRLDSLLQENCGESLPMDSTPLRFGSWMGGDRDGNPNVSATTTERVIWENKRTAARLYAHELSKLAAAYSLERGSREFEAAIGTHSEPYRKFLRPLVNRLLDTVEFYSRKLRDEELGADLDPILTVDELLRPLEQIYASLESVNARVIAEGRLTDIIRRLYIFGLHLLKLDIRQESEQHTQAMAFLLEANGIKNYAELEESEREDILVDILRGDQKIKVPKVSRAEDNIRDIFETFAMLARNDANDFGTYVISMARSPSDVLTVYALQKIFGVRKFLHVAPLFETLNDLENAQGTMARLFELKPYQKLIGERQEIMLGYSDSAKDAGRFASAWQVYQAQENLIQLAAENNKHLVFFHGRGGTISRGGGPIFKALQALPPGSIRGAIRITEQGEMIQNHFGLPGVAEQTLEIYAAATLLSTMDAPVAPNTEMREILNKMSAYSCNHFRKMIRERDEFIPYFRELTPEQEMAYLNVGSRPTRRKQSGGIKSLRAIPWVFAWTQVRLILPVWLGVGIGLRSAVEEKGIDAIKNLYKECAFFQSLIDLIEMAMSKADMQIASVYEKFLVQDQYRDFGKELRQEFLDCREIVLEITGQNVLLEKQELLRESLAVRNPYVDPLNLLQASVLQCFREDNADDLDMDLLLITFNGIVAGMKNAG